MDVKRSGSQPSRKGPAEYFTGTVRVDPLFEAVEPARMVAASVTFEPGARTAWHTHPLGQTLVVTAGCGRAQRWGGPIEEIRSGDVISFAPGEKHWHAASKLGLEGWMESLHAEVAPFAITTTIVNPYSRQTSFALIPRTRSACLS